MSIKLVVQEEPMGCAIACVAAILNLKYSNAKKLFTNPKHAYGRGYYCKEIIQALGKGKKNYEFKKVTEKTKDLLNRNGTFVFIGGSEKYLCGHFLVKGEKGWMNPWYNYPKIAPAKAKFQKKFPGEAQWVIYSID